MPTYQIFDKRNNAIREIESPDELTPDDIDEIYRTEIDSGKWRIRSGAASFGKTLQEQTGEGISGVARQVTMGEPMEFSASPSSMVPQGAGFLPKRTAEQREAELQANWGYQLGQVVKEQAGENFQPNPAYRGEWLAEKIPSTLGSTAPTMALAAIPGVGEALAGLAYSSSAGQSAAQEALDAGHPEMADAAFLLNAPLGYATERGLGVPIRVPRIFKQAAKGLEKAGEVGANSVLLSTLKHGAKGGGKEFVQESLEQVGGNVAAELTYDPNRPILEGVGEAGALGFITGGLLESAAHGTGTAFAKRRASSIGLTLREMRDFDETVDARLKALPEGTILREPDLRKIRDDIIAKRKAPTKTDEVVDKSKGVLPVSSQTVADMEDVEEVPPLKPEDVGLPPAPVATATPTPQAAPAAAAPAPSPATVPAPAPTPAAATPSGGLATTPPPELMGEEPPVPAPTAAPAPAATSPAPTEAAPTTAPEAEAAPELTDEQLEDDKVIAQANAQALEDRVRESLDRGTKPDEVIKALEPLLKQWNATPEQLREVVNRLAQKPGIKFTDQTPGAKAGEVKFTEDEKTRDQRAREFMERPTPIDWYNHASNIQNIRSVFGVDEKEAWKIFRRAQEIRADVNNELDREMFAALVQHRKETSGGGPDGGMQWLKEKYKVPTPRAKSIVQMVDRNQPPPSGPTKLRPFGRPEPEGTQPAAPAPAPAPAPPTPAPATPSAPAAAPQPAPTSAPAPAALPAGYGSQNTIFTQDDAEAALAEIRELMKQMGAGVDPKFLALAIRIAGYHVEAGARKFADFAKRMIDQLGPKIIPYLKSLYESIRHYPGFNSAGMDEPAVVDAELQKLPGAAAAPTPAPAPAPKPAPQPQSEEQLIDRASTAIATRIQSSSVPLTRQEATEIIGQVFGGTLASGRFSAKDVSDIVELAINKIILTNKVDLAVPARQVPFWDIQDDAPHAVQTVKSLKLLVDKAPTQTTRSPETDKLQQFSTPPALAYVANWVANITSDDTVLEPSAGIGGLAVFPKTVGAQVVTNELSERRKRILDQLRLTQHSLNENAEHLNAILQPRIAKGEVPQPTAVVMNPPFSNSTSGESNTLVGAEHVEEALKLLPEGGRLVAIVGEGMAADRARFKPWWKSISQKYNVRANIGISGEEYRKYGTTFGNQIVVIDKTGPTPDGGTVTGQVAKIEDLIPLLEGVRNDRQSPRVKPASPQSGGVPAPQTGAAGGTAGPNVSPPTGPQQLSGPGQGGAGTGGPGTATRPSGPAIDSGVSGNPEAASAGTQTPPSGLGTGTGQGSAPDTSGGLDSPLPPTSSTEGIDVQRQQETQQKLGGDGAVFSDYVPQKVKIEGAQPHPTPLVEATAMAAVPPPDPTHKPKIPQELIENGTLSEAQLEQIIYAGQAHAKVNERTGYRQGHMTGDGTGVGKGRIIAGIILDNWNRGRKKAVWISKTGNLINDAKRDMAALGFDAEKNVIDMVDGDNKEKLKNFKEGTAFLTYKGLATDNPGWDKPRGKLNQAIKKTRKGVEQQTYSRMQALFEWLPRDFDGVIMLDEVHLAGRAIDVQGTFGVKEASQMGLAVVQLQEMFPNARIEYVSATAASDLSGLSFADRLGLWGQGTAFTDKRDFFDKIGAGGLSTLEVLAQNLKALGLYLARTLSFKGVDQRKLTHNITPAQKEMYDSFARAWQQVAAGIQTALTQTGGAGNSNLRSGINKIFFGAQQRAFNTLLTGMQMPSVEEDIKKQLAAGNSVVLQLVNTNAAPLSRELAEQGTDEEFDAENIDLSPRKALLEFIDQHFPTQLHAQKMDDNGNVIMVPVTDAQGNAVEDPEAVAMKQQLMDQMGMLNLPDNPLERILNAFGTENVAEVTARPQRVVDVVQPDGSTKRDVQKRSNEQRAVEVKEFNDGKRRILVFSGAGGTGFSYHAGKDFKNQQRRIHYLVQAGWRADAAIQGFGRTHRSNQASAPEYVLCSTNLKGHERFMATIAKRLAELGALTGGERKSAGSNMFEGSNNLESDYAEDAVTRLFNDLFQNQVEGFSFQDIATRMGYTQVRMNRRTGETQIINTLIDPKTGNLAVSKIPPVQQFLNRILMLEADMQNRLFDEFFDRLQRRIDNAMATGTYDPGLQSVKGLAIRKISDESVYSHPGSTAGTRLVTVEVDSPIKFNTWSDAHNAIAPATPVSMYVRNKRSGNIFALKEGPPRNQADGSVVPTWRRITFKSADIKPKADVSTQAFHGQDPNFDVITEAEAKAQWEADIEASPKVVSNRHTYLVGLVIPIWDRIQIPTPRIWRVNVTGGETLLGIEVPPKIEPGLRTRLNANPSAALTPQVVAARLLTDGQTFSLVNGWQIKRSKVLGEDRIEVTGLQYNQLNRWEEFYGGFIERIAFKPRAFIPTEPAAMVPILEKILKDHPVLEDQGNPSLGSGKGITQESATQAIDLWRAASGSQAKVVLIDAPEWHDNGSGVRGYFALDGTVYLNIAHLDSVADAIAVLNHEGAHILLATEAGQKAVQEFVLRLSPEEVGAIGVQYKRRADETEDEYKQRLAEEFIAKAAEKNGSLWTRFLDWLRGWLAKAGVANLTNEEVARAILRQLDERQKVDPNPMTMAGRGRHSLTPNVEPTDNGPALTMDGKRELSEAISWITDAQFFKRRESEQWRKDAVRKLLDALGPNLEENLLYIKRRAPFDGIPDSVRELAAAEISSRAGDVWRNAANDIDRRAARRLMVDGAITSKMIGSAQGQGLQAMKQTASTLGRGAFVTEYEEMLKTRQEQAYKGKFPDPPGLSIKIKIFLDAVARKAINELKGKLSDANAVASRALNTTRKDFGETWEQIFTSAVKVQGDKRQAIYAAVRTHPALVGLSQRDALQLTNILNEAWVKEWKKVAMREFHKYVPLPDVKEVDYSRLKSTVPELVKQANLGLLDFEAFRNALAAKYGVKRFSEATAKKVFDQAQAAQETPEGSQRDEAYRQVFRTLVLEGGIPMGSLIKSFWYASVLSGLGTQGRNLVGNAWMLVDTFLALNIREPAAFSQLVAGVLRGMRINTQGEFGAILNRGVEPSKLGAKIDDEGNMLEVAKDDPRAWVRGLSNGRFVSRLMIAVDSFFYNANAEMKATFDAYRAGKDNPEVADINEYINKTLKLTDEDRQAAEAQARQEILDGKTHKDDLQRRTNEILRQSRPADIQMEMDRFGLEATLNNEPDGIIGDLAKFLIAQRAKRPYLTPIIPFVRISANVANMLLQHSPVGLWNLFYRRPEWMLPGIKFGSKERLSADEWQMLGARVVMSAAVMLGFAAAAAAYLDDDDPAFQITGTFNNLNPQQRAQLRANGIQPYQIRFGGIGIDYRQTPAAMMLAMVGNYMDGVRYGKLEQKSLDVKLATAAFAARWVITDQSFLSGLAGILGSPLGNPDNVGLFERLARESARPLTGFVPAITKEIDRIVDPNLKESKTFFENIQRDIPVARWSVANKLNVLGEPIARPAYPWSWAVTTQPDDPVWNALGRKAAAGVFVPQVSAAATVIEHGKRRKMNDEEFRRYQEETGKLYRNKLEKDLSRFDRMTPEQAKVYFEKEFAPLREQARQKIR